MAKPSQGNRYSRAQYRRGNLDFAYFCARCGNIQLGAPSAPPHDPPPMPVNRCVHCHAHEWLESAVPATDPSTLDADMGLHLKARRRAERSLAPRLPMPNYYSTETLEPNPRRQYHDARTAHKEKQS